MIGARMSTRLVWALALFAFGCQPQPSQVAPPVDASAGDAAAPIDSAPTFDSGVVITGPGHLVLSEVVSGSADLEFVEIFNPTDSDVDLTDYYLTDSAEYALLPAWSGTPPDLDTGDGLARFPTGAAIAGGAVALVARDEDAFIAAYEEVPEFALYNADQAAAMTIITDGPDDDFTLADAGEVVSLFFWDGQSDRVRDVDMFLAGAAPASGDELLAKQTAAPGGVDGPDPDEAPTLYADDAATMPATSVDDSAGSYHRISLDEDDETTTGGNGLLGHDETSENTLLTWEQDTGTEPTPGVVAPSLLD